MPPSAVGGNEPRLPWSAGRQCSRYVKKLPRTGAGGTRTPSVGGPRLNLFFQYVVAWSVSVESVAETIHRVPTVYFSVSLRAKKAPKNFFLRGLHCGDRFVLSSVLFTQLRGAGEIISPAGVRGGAPSRRRRKTLLFPCFSFPLPKPLLRPTRRWPFR